MKMDLTLTKRDKTLLEILSVVLSVVLFMSLLILPQWNKYTDGKVKLEEVQQKQQDMTTVIASESAAQERIKKGQEEFNVVTADFYPMMESHAIERMITRLALDNGLEARDFDISSKPSASTLEPYFASMLAVEMGLGTEDAEGSAQAEPSDAESSGNGDTDAGEQKVIYSSMVKATVLGQRDNIKAMIDSLYNNFPAIRITSYSISSESAMNAVTGTQTDLSTLSLELEVYMCQK